MVIKKQTIITDCAVLTIYRLYEFFWSSCKIWEGDFQNSLLRISLFTSMSIDEPSTPTKTEKRECNPSVVCCCVSLFVIVFRHKLLLFFESIKFQNKLMFKVIK